MASAPPLQVGSGYLLLPGTSPSDRLDLNHGFAVNPDLSTPAAPNTPNDDEWTIEFWIYFDPRVSPSYPQHVFGDPSAANFDCRTTNGSNLVLSATGLNSLTLTGLSAQTWHHVAFVFDVTAYSAPPRFPSAANLVGYLDGNVVATIPQANPSFSATGTSSSGLAIGGSGTQPSLRGRIDEFRMWFHRRTRCQLIEQRNWKLPLWEQFAPYGLPPEHPDAPNPFAGLATLDPTVFGS